MTRLKFTHIFFTFLASILHVYTLTSLTNITNNYHIESVKDIVQDGFQGIFATARYRGKSGYYKKPISTTAMTLNITALYEADDEFSVLITRSEAPPRYRMEHKFPFSFTKRQPDEFSDPQYKIDLGEDPFTLSVTRSTTKETIFDTSAFDFIYSEFYVSFGITLPSEYLYGLGERRTRHFMYRTGNYTIWTKDRFAMIDEGKGNQQTYGAHPMYLMREASGKWHVVLVRTTSAMNFEYDSTDRSLEFKITGGEIELKFFLGDEYPETAIRMYHNYIGKWTIMPFWTFGYHQSRWGALYLDDLVDVVNNMTEARLPLDVVWSDIDYMENFTDFTVDADRFNPEDFKNLLERVRWVPIIDPGVSMDPATKAYQAGNEYEVWVRSARNNSNYLIGIGWPGPVHWPDWLNPNASKYWSEMLSLMHDIVPYSGIWLDMNENANFCFGEYPTACNLLPNYLPVKGQPRTEVAKDAFRFIEVKVNATEKDLHTLETELNSMNLPYIPSLAPLEDHTLSLDSLHYGNVLSFDFHNLNGFYQSMYTYDGLLNLTGKRPFVMTRSNFIGSGQFGAHWTGDSQSNWEFYRFSIPDLFALQLFGLPMVGADVCGFADGATEELCARWMQLGAFYPFMRNHNQMGAVLQEPYAMGPTVLETSRAALSFRYSILKFYYSVMVRNNGTGTIFRPVFFDFPFHKRLFDLQTQFLIGSELMVAAPDDENITEIDVYFPKGVRWYDMFSGDIMLNVGDHPKNITIEAPLNTTLPVFIRGGSIVHMQDASNVRRTEDLDTTFNLIVALTPVSKDSSVAFGKIMGIEDYLNDDSLDKCTGVNDCMIDIAVNAMVDSRGRATVSVTFDPNMEDSALEKIYVENITFYGMRKDICDSFQSYCYWNDYVVTCTNSEPVQVDFNTWIYVIDDGRCVMQD